MGMFDEIICEYPLPEGLQKYQHEIFQTKELGNWLDLYKITKDGFLILEKISDLREEYDPLEIKDRFSLITDQEITNIPTKLDFTGGFYFYHWDIEVDFFFDVFAWFKDGKLEILEIPKFTQRSLR